MVVKSFRFGGHQHGLRIARLDRGGDTRDQSAARCRRHHDIRRQAQRCHVFGDLPPHRALARDHKRIVIGRHQRGAVFAGDIAGDGFAILAVAIVQHHFGAIALGALALGERRVRRHHDGRLHVRICAAAATPWAWLPDENATTPPPRASIGIDDSLLKAPRNLNEPVRCSISGFRKTLVPARSSSTGDDNSGVRTAKGAMTRAAASISAKLTGRDRDDSVIRELYRVAQTDAARRLRPDQATKRGMLLGEWHRVASRIDARGYR